MSFFSQKYNHQKGAALIVSLLLILAITLPAIVIMRTALLNEKMSASSSDRDRAFQVAEAGLAEAEAFAVSKPEPPTSGCDGGICATPDPADTPIWQNPELWEQAGAYRSGAPTPDGTRPRFVVEYMGVSKGLDQDCTTAGDVSPDAFCGDEAFRYRITVLGESATGAQALLQTSYLVP